MATALPDVTLYYPRGLRSQWRQRRLWETWSQQYPGLFDADDLRLADVQGEKGYLFGEWFAAIYFAMCGYRVVLPKYSFVRKDGTPSYRQKHDEVMRRIGKRRMSVLTAIKEEGGGRPPDLFIYRPRSVQARSSFKMPFPNRFFAEVKVKPDRLKERQRATFARIADSVAPVRIVILLEREHYGPPRRAS